MAAQRARFRGADEVLLEIFQQHIKSTRSLYYQVSGKREPKYLVQAKGLLRGVAQLQQNMALAKKQVL